MPTIYIDSGLQMPGTPGIPCEEGDTVFSAAQKAQVLIPTACMGRATCGLCRVKIIAGEGALSPMNNEEKRHLGNMYYINKLRLSCQARVYGDVTVQIPDARKKKMAIVR